MIYIFIYIVYIYIWYVFLYVHTCKYRSFPFELQTVVEKENFLTLKPKNAFLKVFSVGV
jgi:hypothetical protein